MAPMRFAWLGSACSTLGFFVCGASAVSDLGDAAALVQGFVQTHQHRSGAQTTESLVVARTRTLATLAAGQLPNLATIDCSLHPQMCKPPFNCHKFNALQILPAFLQGLAPRGKAFLGLWCLLPMYQPYLTKCLIDNDLVRAGQIQYEWSVNQSQRIDDVDASYCFIEGHCSNTAVTNSTTLEESYQMCDDRFGHDGWTKFGNLPSILSMIPGLLRLSFQGPEAGFHDPSITQKFLQAACGMGNYHCDVMYCKETYCKNPYYVKKFAHQMPRAPGQLIEEKSWLD